jgi:membrane associated rhomboid family serine protease
MSVYDRQYMNDEETGTGRRSAVSLLIFINILVWIVWRLSLDGHPVLSAIMHEYFTVSREGVLDNYRIFTLFTSAISHVEPEHIFFNMLFFWFVADDVERVYGRLNFFVLYFFCAAVASLAFIVSAQYPSEAALGASGAVMGIALVAAIFDPNRPVSVFGFITLPLKWLVGMLIIIDLSHELSASKGAWAQGMVAHAAHLGGALGGWLFWRFDLRVFRSRGRSQVGILYQLKRFFRPTRKAPPIESDVPRELPREPVAQRKASNKMAVGSSSHQSGRSKVDAATSQRVDELLSKISREGMNALTDEERRFLHESSQKYKK